MSSPICASHPISLTANRTRCPPAFRSRCGSNATTSTAKASTFPCSRRAPAHDKNGTGMGADTTPDITGISHISITVRDIEASATWYQRVFRAQRVPMTFPHYEREESGYGVLLIEPRSGLGIGLHANTGNDGKPFDEARTGMDHVG